MAKVEGEQNVPAEFAYLYEGALQYKKVPWGKVCVRYPWSIGSIYAERRGFSLAQKAQRNIFKRAVNCYNCQPYTGGKTPPGWGPRNRSWWYNDAVGSGLWYYDYFMQQTINEMLGLGDPYWCKAHVQKICYTHEGSPNSNFWWQDWCLVSGRPTTRKYMWFQRTDVFVPKLYILYAAGGGTFPNPTSYKILIHKQLVDWDETTITWNTQPALGEQIGEYIIVPANTWGLQKIELPANVTKFCVTGGETTDWFCMFWSRSTHWDDGYARLGI